MIDFHSVGTVPRVEHEKVSYNPKTSIFRNMGGRINSINARPMDLYNTSMRYQNSSDLRFSNLNPMQKSNYQ